MRLAEPIALTSIFPYAWALVKKFQIGNEQDASFYAGLLISSFSLAEALMGMYWGGLSDRIGRKPVLMLGCLGTMFSMVMVGFASNIWIALLGRAVGGLLNGNIGVIQTMVGELVTKPEHERKYISVAPSDSPIVKFDYLPMNIMLTLRLNDSKSFCCYALRMEYRDHYRTMYRRHVLRSA